MFEVHTGRLWLAELPIVLGPELCPTAVLRHAPRAAILAGTALIRLGRHRLDEHYAQIDLEFFGAGLDAIHLGFDLAGDESARHQAHRAWVERHGGVIRRPWGRIGAEWDPKTETSSIVIRYRFQGQPWP